MQSGYFIILSICHFYNILILKIKALQIKTIQYKYIVFSFLEVHRQRNG